MASHTLTDEQLHAFVQRNVDAVAPQIGLQNRANALAVLLAYLPRAEALAVIDALLRHDHRYWTTADATLDQTLKPDQAANVRRIVAAEAQLAAELPGDRATLAELSIEHRARFAFTAIAGSATRFATLIFTTAFSYFALIGDPTVGQPGQPVDPYHQKLLGMHAPEYRRECEALAVRMNAILEDAQSLVTVATTMPKGAGS